MKIAYRSVGFEVTPTPEEEFVSGIVVASRHILSGAYDHAYVLIDFSLNRFHQRQGFRDTDLAREYTTECFIRLLNVAEQEKDPWRLTEEVFRSLHEDGYVQLTRRIRAYGEEHNLDIPTLLTESE